MASTPQESYTLSRNDSYFSASFHAMASPCELLIATTDEALAGEISERGVAEVKRIENKYSRYVKDNLCYAINNAKGKCTDIDEECYRLLTFAQTCFELSEGMFDLTSGVLRRVWTFDGSDRIPQQSDIDSILPFMGWEKVVFNERTIQMRSGMEIDFGGIGKEYAVSTVAEICKHTAPDVSVLINLGGDIQITKPRENGQPWLVGIENNTEVIQIIEGALATSGDAKRYLLKNGKRYSHILNPKTGWPIQNAPASVTTLAPFCIQAGCLATLALLNGKKAEKFLKEQDVKYWCSHA